MPKIQSIIATAIFLIALSIAIPTFVINVAEKSYLIRGIEADDISENLILDFNYKPAVDLQGGHTITYEVDIDRELTKEQRLEEFDKVKNIIARRMALIGLRDFEFTTFLNQEENRYKISLTTPQELEENLAQVLISPGVLDILVSSGEESENSETLFPGTVSSGITNSDISHVRVISDSRIYAGDPEKPNNFGLEVSFTEEGREKITSALISNSGSSTPLIFTLDGSLVASQAGGQQLNVFGSVDKLLLVTYFADTELNNSVIGAVMSTDNLETAVEIESTLRVLPTLGVNALNNLKIASFSSVILLYLFLMVSLRKRGLYALLGSSIFITLLIAIQKLVGMNLSFSLVTGFLTVHSVFALYQVRLIQQASKLSSTKSINDFIENHSLSTWKMALRLVILAFMILFFENLLTISVNQFIQSVISGLIVWLLFNFVFLKPLMMLFIKAKN